MYVRKFRNVAKTPFKRDLYTHRENLPGSVGGRKLISKSNFKSTSIFTENLVTVQKWIIFFIINHYMLDLVLFEYFQNCNLYIYF